MKNYGLTLFGVKETTKIIAEFLYALGIKVDLIVSIDAKVAIKNNIADYKNLSQTAIKIGADYYPVKNYSLGEDENKFFKEHSFEIGIAYGWQRLIPGEVLKRFKHGIYGFHASLNLLPIGRGRSPLNWALIKGADKMYNHCIRYSAEADAGDIYSVTQFSITPYDTILTLIYKSLLIAKKDIPNLLKDIENNVLSLTPQQGSASLLSKRTPEDGLINFKSSSTIEIVNLIRAVTKPFSGAFCHTPEGKKIIIWEAWPFEEIFNFSSFEPGEIIDNIYTMPIIKTLDGSIIVKEYEGEELRAHMKLV